MQISLLKKNLRYGILNYIIVNILKFLVRLVFVRTLAIEYLGLNGLFTNILSFLSLAELGIGPAIVYSLYKPIAFQDKDTIKPLMLFFKRTYFLVGFCIFSLGIIIYPWLDKLVKTPPDITNWQLYYLIFLLNTSISYLWSYQRNLLIADQKQFYVNNYQAIVQTGVSILQITLLYSCNNYWFYLFAMLAGTIIENITISNRAYKLFPFLKEPCEPIASSTKQEIIKNTKAMLIHKLAAVIVFSSSSIILSKYVGLTTVALYSNYLLVTGVLSALLNKLYAAITATIGNALLTDSLEVQQKHFELTQLINSWLTAIMTTGLFVLVDPFIELWLGQNFVLDQTTTILFIISFYTTTMRKPLLMYRDASGLFWQDIYKAIVETIINLIACIYLTQRYCLAGLILGGIISTVTTCLWFEPYILFKFKLKLSLTNYFINYAKQTGLTILSAISLNYLWQQCPHNIYTFCVAAFMICIVVTFIWYLSFRKIYKNNK